MGLEEIVKKFRPHILNKDKQRLFVGNSNPNEGKAAQAIILLNDAVQHASKNGKFHDQLAKLILVNIYTEWDELYRPMIAAEHETDSKCIKSDLMGDLRLIRHCIIHNKSKLTTKEIAKLKVLRVKSEMGRLIIPEQDFAEIMNHINKMSIEIPKQQ